jgi:hypothetical protein
MTSLPDDLKRSYVEIEKMRSVMETMRKNQSLRGVENLKLRMAQRASTHTSWRQMKGMKLFLHEINHPGNQPFVIGLGYVRL